MLLSARAPNDMIRQFAFPWRDSKPEKKIAICLDWFKTECAIACGLFVSSTIGRRMSDNYPMLLTESDEQQNTEQ